MARPHEVHREAAPKSLRVGVVTVSDSRTEATDESGKLIRAKLLDANHSVPFCRVVREDPDGHRERGPRGNANLRRGDYERRHAARQAGVTIEAIEPKLEKVLRGFGELFRILSHERIGSAAMMSRALAGVYKGACLRPARLARWVSLAMDRLILPDLSHGVGAMRR